jgi:hypothetical protein
VAYLLLLLPGITGDPLQGAAISSGDEVGTLKGLRAYRRMVL